MFADRRRLIVGGGIVAVVALVLWMQLSPSTETATVAPARPRGGRPAASAATEPVRPLRLDSLTSSRSEPNDAQRNPFRFQPRPAPAPPPSSKPVTPVTKPADTLAAPVVPPGPPPVPPIPLKFVGVLTRQNGVQWAVLTDGKTSPFYGREGDIIDGRYRIVKIGTESIELTYADGKGRQTVRLTGQ